ncbi:MAG: 23S rRNA (uracil(1939)-C(5))-methyltransferase RlmD [Firmicutes bacterium]|nr:23S rRNA (uracil(1939)-C(5))-methyltransferase RlmD [Bacillota bacterium]
MKKDIYECIKLDRHGYGLVLDNNRTFTIANLLPFEKAEITIFQNGFGKVEKFIKTSDDRVKAKCSKFNECGGCQLQHIPYLQQVELKTNLVKEYLEQYSLDSSVCLPCIGMKDPFFYRNKSQMVISDKNKKVMSGFYEENTHSIINIDQCVIQVDTANTIIKTCKNIMQQHKIHPYDEDKKTGLIRHILVRASSSTKQILVVIVTAQEMFPGRNNFIKALREAHPEITTIVQNVNSRATSVVLGDFERILYGKGTILDIILGKTFILSSRTFYQVNTKQTELLYKKALELVKPTLDDVVLDAYSGVGTIGIIFSDHVKKVLAVEISKEAVKNSIQNAKLNKAYNVRFNQDDAPVYLSKLAYEKTSIDTIIVDPPRLGLNQAFLDSVKIIKPKKFLYISCDPETLARDLKILVGFGYSLRQVQPIDMFPQTNHVESITLLSLK